MSQPIPRADSSLRQVTTPAELGAIAAAVRIAQGVPADALTPSHTFISGLENGRETIRLGKVMEVLAELGIRILLDVPAGIVLPDDLTIKRRRRISR